MAKPNVKEVKLLFPKAPLSYRIKKFFSRSEEPKPLFEGAKPPKEYTKEHAQALRAGPGITPTRSEYLKKRFLEIVPGVTSWSLVTAPLWLSAISPKAAVAYTAGYTALFVGRSMNYFRRALNNKEIMLTEMNKDWLGKLRTLTPEGGEFKELGTSKNETAERLNKAKVEYEKLRKIRFSPAARMRYSSLGGEYAQDLKAAERELEAAKRDYHDATRAWKNREKIVDWRGIHHVIMVTAYKEGNRQILRDTVESICRSNYAKENGRLKDVTVVFVTEKGDKITPPIINDLTKEFSDKVDIIEMAHSPEPGTVPGKSTAMHWAGRAIAEGKAGVLTEKLKGVKQSNILITDLDADSNLHPQYLPMLTFRYAADRKRDKAVYQSYVLLTQRFWEAPLYSRASASGVTTWSLGADPQIFANGYAGSLKLLKSVDFWPVDQHSQDSGLQRKLEIKHGDAFKVKRLQVPTYNLPVIPPTKKSENELKRTWKTVKAVTVQTGRWKEGPIDDFVRWIMSPARPGKKAIGSMTNLAHSTDWDIAGPVTATGVGTAIELSKRIGSPLISAQYAALGPASGALLTGGYMVGIFGSARVLKDIIPPTTDPAKMPLSVRKELIKMGLIQPVVFLTSGSIGGLRTTTRYMFKGQPQKFIVTKK